MIPAALRRLGAAALTLAGVAVVVFVLLRVVPGDPIAMMIAPGARPADIAALRAQYGLDASLPVQFVLWLKAALAGDLGTSISLRRDVWHLLGERLPATLELAGVALALALALGGTVAVVGTLARGTLAEAAIDAINGALLAIPDFVWAIAFVLVLGVLFPVLPLSGRIEPTQAEPFATNFFLLESLLRLHLRTALGLAAHLAMPALALALPLATVIARVLKDALAEAMVQDYVLLARLKGMSMPRLVLQEALRNAIGPALALTGVQFTFLLGGTVIVERIFAYPGLGNLAIEAVINRDLPLIQGLVLLFGALFILVNIVVDLLVIACNPRLRHG